HASDVHFVSIMPVGGQRGLPRASPAAYTPWKKGGGSDQLSGELCEEEDPFGDAGAQNQRWQPGEAGTQVEQSRCFRQREREHGRM
ncbi:hypothetical protein LTR17_023609, partial [Elasticomyces elasticus]